MAKEMLPEIFSKYSELGAMSGGKDGAGGLQELLKNPSKIGAFFGDMTQILKKNNRLFDVRDLVIGLTQKDELNKACDLFFEFTNSAEAAANEQEETDAASSETPPNPNLTPPQQGV